MAATIISVTFETDAQRSSEGRFSIPESVCNILGVQSGDSVALVIESSAGIRAVTKTLVSGKEIYGDQVADVVKAGERIRVTALCPVRK